MVLWHIKEVLWVTSVVKRDLQMVDCERAPTPGSLRLARAFPTSHWVTPSLIRLCLNLSAKASNSRGSVSASDIAMGGPWGWWEWWGWCVRGVWGLIMPPWVLYIDMEGWMWWGEDTQSAIEVGSTCIERIL